MSVTKELKYTIKEGGEWYEFFAHSIQMPDGTEWDAVNGWRKNKPRVPQLPVGAFQ